ncbi:glycosyltransferase family A protein [Acinetobacter sp. ANC 3882]|uniref:glycosyltransferase family 2 protein n=1 Tax=Acinetobacter sp. ANC 3882 TaxID=2923423 RepID=UPI001F4A283F|nr:glycosyltransferase family A protein [Acinetobacter sp. ANC 3882]MCH7315764.1 glycosyltransferase [Acinetobacter sp. ANC 3882]
MISIGIPFYNAEAYLEDAIKSVLAQTFQEWELILVDDGSIDGSLNIAKKFEQLDARVRVLSDGLNKKLPARLNEIISEAKFNLIARMDADDLMDVERLEKQYDFLIKNPEYDLVTTGMYSIDQHNKVLGKRLPENRIMQADEILGGLTNLLHASMLAKKQWCLRNTYRENNALAEDYELWLSAAIKNDLKYYVLQEPLYYYREVENVKKEKMIKGYNTQIEVINRYYSNVISNNLKNKIILKFELKKIIVKIFNFFNLMFILQMRRVNNITVSDQVRYKANLDKILSV